jgi:atypical dual specificity phosphatase
MTDSNPAIRTIPEDSNPTQNYPKAVAARIGDRELWLGNSGAIEPDNLATMGIDPEYVVSVNKRTTTATTDHHPLVDARINDPDQFATAVETARERYRQSGTLLVNCAAGISRSTTVVATVLAVEEDMAFEQAVSAIRDTRQLATPHRKLQINAYSYLVTEHGRETARDELRSLVESAYIGGEDAETALKPLEHESKTNEDGVSVNESTWKETDKR